MQDPVARPLKKAAGLESADIKAASMDRGKEDAAAMAPRMPEVIPQAALPSPFQSMKEYIRRHYRRQILAELENRVAKGMLQKPDAGGREPAFLRLGACTLGDMAFWRCDPYTVLADLRVKAELNAKKQIVTRDLYCELLIDMRKNGAFEFGEAGLLEERPARSGWMLSGYLVPILSREEVERGAEELLLRYCPRAWTNRREHDAYILADRMGLRVERLPLYRKRSTRSMLFFDDGTMLAAEEDRDGRIRGRPRLVCIKAGTILINTNAVHKDACQMEIYHECIHYDWHFMFFRLQDMQRSDASGLNTGRVIVAEDKAMQNPMKWMEWQARRGSFGLMMPQSRMRSLIAQIQADPACGGLHAGQRMDRIARCIAREYALPKYRVRARLIQLGYIAAKGALNYVDGGYIEPFAFSLDHGGKNYSFVIGRESAFALYQTDETFRRHIQSGRYLYVDGHICRNDPRCVRQGAWGMRLTPWANAHVDVCCLRFAHVYERRGVTDCRFGTLHSDEEYNSHYLAFVQGKGRNSEREQLEEMSRMMEALPATFHEALTFLMKQAHVTIEELEEKAFLSGRTISRLRTEERREYSLDQVMAICIALHLPPWLSRGMLQRTGFILRPTRQHQAYQFILDCLFMDSVEDVQAFLLRAGYQKLRLTSHEA